MPKDENSAENRLSRRDISAALGIAGAIGPSVVSTIAATSIGSPKATDLANAIGPHRLNARPAEIVKEFGSLRPGDLMPHYQLFWRVYRSRRQLTQLAQLAAEAETSALYSKWTFRARALPVLAHIHALGACLISSRSDHEHYILQAHKSALGLSNEFRSKPDREVLELIWRTMLAALIRNEDTWQTFSIGDELLDEAEALTKAYLSGELALYGPAIAAMQFLLTYEIATKTIKSGGALRASVPQRISGLLAIRADDRAMWLRAIVSLYSKLRTFDQVIPHLGEVFMGNTYNIFNDREVNDFSVLVQLKRFFINSLSLHKTIQSPYVDSGWSHIVEDAILPVLSNYGITPSTWERLRLKTFEGKRLLPHLAVDYFDSKFASYDVTFASEDIRFNESMHAKGLAQWIPFHRLDEERISKRTWRTVETALSAFGAVRISGFRELWEKTIASEGQAFAKQCNFDVSSKVVVDRAFQAIPEEKISEFAEIADEAFDRLKSSERPQVGGPLQFIENPDISPAGGPTGSHLETGHGTPPYTQEEHLSASNDEKISARQAPVDKYQRMLSFPMVVNFADFNAEQLNGENIEHIQRQYAVEVEVLGPQDPITKAYPIVVCGSANSVNKYLVHLIETWPGPN